MSEEFKKLKLAELKRVSTEVYKDLEKIPVIVVLDNIRSLHNVGSVFRTADAFRINAIWLSGFTARPPHREIHKTALGATETVEWKYFESPKDAIDQLKAKGFQIVPIEQSENSTSLLDFKADLNQKYAVILGNEVEGVSQDYMEAAHDVIEIPQEGTKHSLNVSIACGIVLWEMFKNLK